MQKIDAHCHTTNRLLRGSANPDASLNAIAARMREHDIVRTVLLATYFPERGTGISNFRMHHWIKGRPEFVMFGSLDMQSYFYQGYNELEELAEQGLIHGIKLYPAYQRIDLESERLQLVVTLAERHGLPLMFHGGVSYMLWQRLGPQGVLALPEAGDAARPDREPYWTPHDFERIARRFPGVNLIISHLCKPFFDELVAVLRRNDNVVTDISGIFDSLRDADYRPDCVDQVRRVLGECGPAKVLFGTDFPVQTHADSVFILEQALRGYTEADQQLVAYGNAARLIFGGVSGAQRGARSEA